jgi:hypothetical protein
MSTGSIRAEVELELRVKLMEDKVDKLTHAIGLLLLWQHVSYSLEKLEINSTTTLSILHLQTAEHHHAIQLRIR